jgi:hypothetical protein
MEHQFLHLIMVPLFKQQNCVLTLMSIQSTLDIYAFSLFFYTCLFLIEFFYSNHQPILFTNQTSFAIWITTLVY